MRRLASLGLFALCSTLAACAAGAGDDTDEVDGEIDDSGKADASTELRVRAGDTTLWVNQQLTRRDDVNGPAFFLRGRTSRDLEGGRGFIFDDVYGDFFQRSTRTFEVMYPVSTGRTLVDGVNQFINLNFKHSASRPDLVTARAVVRPRLESFSGSSHLYFTAELTPVVYGGRTVYRIYGHTTGANDVTSVVQVQVGDQSLTDIRIFDYKRFEIDLDPEQALAIAGTSTEIAVTAFLPSGQVTKRMKLGLSIKKLGFTVEDVNEVWPPLTCTNPVKACLQALPDGSLDLASCGEAVVVNKCAGQVGVFVDDVAFTGALHSAQTQIAAASFRTDAVGLVGADQVEGYLYNAEQTVESKLEGLFGRWYLSATTRATALTSAVDGAIDTALAHPVDLIDGHTPVAGNVAATRQVVADAVLLHVGAMDLRATEWGRTMEELVHEFRAMHVQSIRNFRETVSPEPYPGHPEWDVYVGDWLGAYIEVSVVKTTGAVANVYLEID